MRRSILALCLLALIGQSAGASEFRFSPRPNDARLIRWRSWGQDAFDEARKKDKLVLLSLSAVWCHWCHVMDETTYSDPEVISYINENCIPVRVDADARPDIDALYNQGGWPSTAILTPEGEVVSGGNYLSSQELLSRLKRAAAFIRNNRAALEERIAEIKAMKELKAVQKAEFADTPGKSTVAEILELIRGSFDAEHGGFGAGQKFPSPDAVDFLLARYAREQDPKILHIITTTLDNMAKGGLRDRVEGGFFRYATKPDWSEPHYEKMLDVNAGMIRNYADAALVTGREDYVRVVKETIEYVRARLYDAATGAFYGSQDADETYYVKQNRKGMQPPAVDKTSYADSSSLMISALVAAYGATGEERSLGMAVKSMEFILAKLFGEQGVSHYRRGEGSQLKGLLLDNALAGTALLDLYNATGERRYLDSAKKTGRLIVSRYYDAEKKRFRPYLNSALKKPVTAGVLSGMNDDLANYRALGFVSRLEYFGTERTNTKIREAVSATLAASYREHAPAAAAYGNALLWSVEDPVEFVVLADAKRAREYLSVVNSVYVPQKVVWVLSLAKDAAEIKKRKYALEVSVYVCAGKRCSKPLKSRERLRKDISAFVGDGEKTDERERVGN